jgi:hypothetical protein
MSVEDLLDPSRTVWHPRSPGCGAQKGEPAIAWLPEPEKVS